jgi:hypothetical protein
MRNILLFINDKLSKKVVIKILMATFAFILLMSPARVHSTGNTTLIGRGEIYSYDEVVLLPYADIELIERDGILYIRDKENTFTAHIIQDRLDKNLYNNIQEYYGDKFSTEKEIFNKFLDLKENLFTSKQEYYNIGFLYGDRDTGSDLAMKVFAEYEEKVFGQDGYIRVYNTLQSDKNYKSEKTHIDITIPAPYKKTIYSINFILDKGSLNIKTLTNMSNLLCSLYILELPPQNKPLKVFRDIDVANLANEGIYPDFSDSLSAKKSFAMMKNEQAGYTIRYPSYYLPYMKNAIIDSFDYRSYKMDNNNYFSITVRDIAENESLGAQRIDDIKKIYGDKMHIIENGRKNLSEHKYFYFIYELDSEGEITYVQDYSTIINNRIFIFELKSKYSMPSPQIKHEFIDVLSSLELLSQHNVKAHVSTSLSKYVNMEGKYYISYPQSWSITKSQYKEESEDALSFKNSLSSGPLDIIITEGNINPDAEQLQVLQYLAGTLPAKPENGIVDYKPPYHKTPNKLLSSYYYTKDNTCYFVKLINYLDISNRNKMCYAVDIIRDNKIYSLFIIASDYASQEGKLQDKVMSAFVNLTADSFLQSTSADFSLLLKGECKALLEQIFNTEVEVQLPSEENLEYSNSAHNNETKFFTIISARFGNISAYFGIEVNLLNGDIKLTSFHPREQIIENIKKVYSENGTYDVFNYFINDSNQFEIMVFMVSKLDGSFKIIKVKLEYNSSKKDVNVISLWSTNV